MARDDGVVYIYFDPMDMGLGLGHSWLKAGLHPSSPLDWRK